MVLLDRVLAHDEDATTCSIAISDQTVFREADGCMPVWFGIEYMAQCIAAREGCIAHAEGRALAPGFIVRARRVRLHVAAFRAGEVLRVRVRRLRGRPGLGAMTYACDIRSGGLDPAVVAEAEITVALGREIERGQR